MIVSMTLTFIGIALFVGVVLQTVLPGFSWQKRYAVAAARLLKSHAELRRMGKDPISLYVADRLIPQLSARFSGFENMRKMYEALGRDKTFEEALADMAVKSLIGAVPFLVLPIITKAPITILAMPLFSILAFFVMLGGIKKSYQKRQREIVKDLPKLISKLMVTLETGRPFIGALQRLEETSGPRMRKMLGRLNANIQVMGIGRAIDQFAYETGVPVMREFAAAVKVGVHNGYSEAKEHFDSIKNELRELRLAALRETTRSNPEKVKFLYMLLALHAFGAVLIAFYAIFTQIQFL
ncbi:MAG: hypothetical protein BAA01_11445 [Bacillus thermozeamaize]|uniref:Type II secretion system protein GspF domain-containing protein n=1 Tax=Bacillus thermozeamaize TaxID=230954 RepID=A0A1Y3PKE8_9BACI|nr:MAG: hypothetical protein BAA01_11445 [Bacillus thermozeamaize]